MNSSNNALTEAVYYILLALIEPLHGYGIMQRTAQLSRGRLVISAGTLYGALSTLMDKGWIKQLEIVADSRRKEYIITSAGRMVLTEELERLRELVMNGDSILNGANY
jgi:DNA-binding PadR family transcriptional regulator